MSRDQRQRRARGVAALVALFRPCSRPGLGVGVDREDAVADRHAARDRQIEQRARRFLRHDLEMQRLAANDAAERDRALVGLAGTLGGVERHRDGGRDLERARHAHALVHRTGFLQRARGAREQGIGDVLVEARLDDEDTRALEIARTHAGGPSRLSHDLFSTSAWS